MKKEIKNKEQNIILRVDEMNQIRGGDNPPPPPRHGNSAHATE